MWEIMRLTSNFSKSEFDSKCGRPMPDWVLNNVKELAKNLQVIRNHFGVAISVNSGYRSPEHNKAVGGSPTSQHLTGKAADLTSKHISVFQLHNGILKLIDEGKISEGGVGFYPNNNFVHYDIRGTKARWKK
jgi:uncharacterized protein YcbK (DUF882 family)